MFQITANQLNRQKIFIRPAVQQQRRIAVIVGNTRRIHHFSKRIQTTLPTETPPVGQIGVTRKRRRNYRRFGIDIFFKRHAAAGQIPANVDL